MVFVKLTGVLPVLFIVYEKDVEVADIAEIEILEVAVGTAGIKNEAGAGPDKILFGMLQLTPCKLILLVSVCP